jgi:cell filamentation protein, protein adenylyltransferase
LSSDPGNPYNDLPLLPPKAELETKAVLRKAIAANKALAELKGRDERIFLNPKLLDLLRRQEK